jgi:uncharacterized protein (DUF2235 family)
LEDCSPRLETSNAAAGATEARRTICRNILVCADGTGNSFGHQVSNVARLIQLIDVSCPERQIAFYDQGIGTDPRHVNEIERYRNQPPVDPCALTVLAPPWSTWAIPRSITKVAGLSFGYGLFRNVRELYQALAEHYTEDGGKPDKVYLFGFSRGAFTVRALAGLIHRCGLLPKSAARDEGKFAQAYALYAPHLQDYTAVARFREQEGVRSPRVHFLGLWDTVKSYGGIWPKSLPHLRHNPIVCNVRHALALDERRSWFLPTSWGGIDSDGPMDVTAHPEQSVVEVWFRGCHSDVGGGYDNGSAARIPLRWMLNEAASAGLKLNQAGRDLAVSADPGCPIVHDSLTAGWIATEYVPRWELDNSYSPPKRFFKCGRTGVRYPVQFKRDHTVLIHSSVGPEHMVGTRRVETRVASFPEQVDDAVMT